MKTAIFIAVMACAWLAFSDSDFALKFRGEPMTAWSPGVGRVDYSTDKPQTIGGWVSVLLFGDGMHGTKHPQYWLWEWLNRGER